MRFGVVAGAALLLGAAPFMSAPFAHDLIGTKVTWDREIAPIVEARCVSCHRDGGPAPMSLATYDEARPWARAIREEVLTRRMPKWPVVRGYGDFTNDPSLSPFEIALITAWVDGGAPASANAPAGKPQTAKAPAGKPQAAKAPASAIAPAGKPAGKPAGRAVEHSQSPGQTRDVTVPCSSGTLPEGRLVGLQPQLEAGGALRMTVTQPDGLETPLLWVKAFEPEFAARYWLRNPVRVRSGTRAAFAGTAPCAVRLTYQRDAPR